MEDIAINVCNVSKIYKLYNKPSDRLIESLGLTKKKCYTEHYALDKIDFTIRKGETIGIIGTNGSGKSTILKIVTGVLSPTFGKVTVDGRISALLELGAGFNPEYTGIENIYLNGTMIGFSKEEIENKLDNILKFADIGDFINQPVKTYSSGMFVRLAFAVAINIEPEILIVDEALSVGDVFFQAKCFKKINEFKENGKTILLVSHDLSSINKYCDRVILLDKGLKLQEGEPKEIIDLYKKVLVNQFDSNDDVLEDITLQSNELWKSQLTLNPNTIEYGEKNAEIIDFCIIDDKKKITNTIEKGSSFTIRMKVKFKENINEPIFAYTIKDLKGTDITGTNTMYEKSDVIKTEAGDIREISFSQDMNLQGGQYLLSLGCTGYKQGNFTVYHRLYDICNIAVVSEKDTVGYFDMNSVVNVK